MVEAAAVIQQPGKVELLAIPNGVPPTYLRFMRPAKPLYVTMKEYEDISPTTSIDIQTIKLLRHRVFGLSVGVAYWPESWQDAWAIEELLKWEGRENEIRSDKYYADFIIDENQQAHPNRTSALEPKSVLSRQQTVVLEPLGSSDRRDSASWSDVLGSGQTSVLRLERGVHGGYAADL